MEKSDYKSFYMKGAALCCGTLVVGPFAPLVAFLWGSRILLRQESTESVRHKTFVFVISIIALALTFWSMLFLISYLTEPIFKMDGYQGSFNN